jgi:translation initiation factor 2 gamma subunit (eIF-2gamma)
MADLMSHPESVRNVAVVGHLHHGKTALLDMLVHETHDFEWDTSKPVSNQLPFFFITLLVIATYFGVYPVALHRHAHS